jgi:hypothetical protein
LATRIARKTLLAVAGLVSCHDATWTTDRASSAARWAEVEPGLAGGLERLVEWSAGAGPSETTAAAATSAEVADALESWVQPIVDRFAEQIGLWTN